ncbi:hypothetical protein THAOC_11770, partial [Thalassiosira oceanica]
RPVDFFDEPSVAERGGQEPTAYAGAGRTSSPRPPPRDGERTQRRRQRWRPFEASAAGARLASGRGGAANPREPEGGAGPEPRGAGHGPQQRGAGAARGVSPGSCRRPSRGGGGRAREGCRARG